MNNGLSQVGNQLLNIWKQLGVGQRISIALTTLLVALGLTALVFWSSRPDYALLYGKLDEAEAAKVVAALDEAKVPYQINRGGGSISVPSDKVHYMRMQLASKGIPRGEGVGFEIFDKPNFGISDFVQRANYLRAVQGELSRTIGQVDAIEAARVMIVMPENRLLVDNTKNPPPPSSCACAAMVSFRPRPLTPSASWSPTPSKVSSPTTSAWWTTRATCFPRTTKTIPSAA